MNAMQALALANEVRMERAKLKRSIRDGEVDPVEVIQTDESGIKVLDVLLCVERVGPTKAQKILRQAGVTPNHTLGGEYPKHRPVSDGQREKLAEIVGWRVARYWNSTSARRAA